MIPSYVQKSIAMAFKKRLESIDVLRYAAGYYDDHGFWVQEDPTVIQILADIQPITGEALERIADGRDLKDVVSVWTMDVIRGLNEDDKIQPDQIIYGGKKYEIENIQIWDSHIEAIGIRTQDE